ncbi:MAG: hypothetical protein WCS18_11585 [Sphaerochaetaceae bacterium]
MVHKGYEVDSVNGRYVNCLKTTITAERKGFTVFVFGKELWFPTFEEAYKEAERHCR